MHVKIVGRLRAPKFDPVRSTSVLGKRRSPRVGRDVNLYVEGAHERTRQRSTRSPLVHTTGWRAGKKQRLPLKTKAICKAPLARRLAHAFGKARRQSAAHGGHPRRVLLCTCLMPSRRARVTRDQRRRHAPRICVAFVGELHAARSRGTPTLPALELLPSEKRNLTDDEKRPSR